MIGEMNSGSVGWIHPLESTGYEEAKGFYYSYLAAINLDFGETLAAEGHDSNPSEVANCDATVVFDCCNHWGRN